LNYPVRRLTARRGPFAEPGISEGLWTRAAGGLRGRVTIRWMPVEPPIAELPDEVTFSLDQAAMLLFVSDVAVESTAEGSAEHAMARRAQRLITSRLWPDLGALLDDEDEGDE
jgi:hypothetical protein